VAKKVLFYFFSNSCFTLPKVEIHPMHLEFNDPSTTGTGNVQFSKMKSFRRKMQNYFTGSLITKLKPNGFNHQPRTKISKVNLIVFRLI